MTEQIKIAGDEQHEISPESSVNVQLIMELQKNDKSLIEIIVSLLIKEYEAFIGPMAKVYALIDGHQDAVDACPKRELDELERLKLNYRYFTPKTSVLFYEVEACGKLATSSDYNEETFGIIVSHTIIAELHLHGESNPALLSFELQEGKTNEMLQSSTQEERDQFWNSRQTFIELYREKEWGEFELARIVLDVSIADQQYLKEFGELLIENTRLGYHLQELTLKIDLKTENPGLSMEDLDIEVTKHLSFQKKKEGQLQNKHQRYSEALMNGIGLATTQESQEELEKNRREIVHQLTIGIKHLIHDDSIVQHPNYNKLNENDRKFLEDLLKELPSANQKNLDSNKLFHGYDLHSPNDLRLMVYRAKTILENAGIDTLKTDTLIPGDDLGQKIEFLHLEIIRLKRLVPFLRAQFSGYTKHILKVEKALRNPENERESLRIQIQIAQDNIIDFEKQLQELFEEQAEQGQEQS